MTSGSAAGGRGLGHGRQFLFRNRRGNEEHSLALVVEHRHARGRGDVAHVNALADLQLLDVDFDDFGQILRQTFDVQLAHDVFEYAATRLHARRFADGANRNAGAQFLGREHFVKINVQDRVLNRMMLHFLDEREAVVRLAALVNLQVHQHVLAGGVVERLLQILDGHGHVDRLGVRPVDDRGNDALRPHPFHRAPAGLGARLRFQLYFLCHVKFSSK